MWNFLCLDISSDFNKVSDLVPKLMVCFKLFSVYFNIVWFHDFFIVFFQGLRTSWSWPRSRPFWSSGWLCYRYSRRCRSPWNSTAASTVCWNDFNPYFRRGLGSLRPHRGHLPVHECELDSGYEDRKRILREVISKFAHFLLWFWNFFSSWVLFLVAIYTCVIKWA